MVEFRFKLDGSKSKVLDKLAFKKLLIWCLLFSTIMIAIGIVCVIFRNDDSDLVMGIALIIFGVLLTPVSCLVTYIMRKVNDESTTYISDETEEIYTFDEQYITILQTTAGLYSATLKAKYPFIYKVRESKNSFYLYVSKVQCYIVDKSSITQGTLEEFSTLLKSNLGDKFKSK